MVSGRKRCLTTRTLYGLTFAAEDWPGRTAEELAADYQLPLEAVQEAIAYCESKPAEIQADWEMEEALMAATGMNDPSYKYHRAAKTLSPNEHEQIVRRYRP